MISGNIFNSQIYHGVDNSKETKRKKDFLRLSIICGNLCNSKVDQDFAESDRNYDIRHGKVVKCPRTRISFFQMSTHIWANIRDS